MSIETPKHDTGLIIVPAGAGAGKTHRIKTTLVDWVKRGRVRADRILAVTFTETAAAELRERIRTSLLEDGMVTEAMAVERAYVSTIHGLGLRLLTEHALAAGASPQPRHLGDAERDLLIRQALATSKSLDPIKAHLDRYGYSYSFGNNGSAEDSLRARVLSIIDLLRGLGDAGQNPNLVAPALANLADVYGEVLPDANTARATLLGAITAMLNAFPDGVSEGITVAAARTALEKGHGIFCALRDDPDRLDWDWATWQKLRGLRVSNSKTKLPDGYDDLAAAIMEAADVLPIHSGPLKDAETHLECLIACAQEVMEAYEDKKRKLGLIDYADMIAGAERLLRTQPGVRDAVLGEIDCVIIDEFQDTNPVQFALLWQLGARAPRTLLVGDVKQSIMGFQGADPRLSAALTAAHPEATDPLDKNWRSTPAVMQFVNALGAGLFGDGYGPLTPTREPVDGVALDIIRVSQGRRVRKYDKPQNHIAERIAHILKTGETITDRHTGATRPARPSDIALLVGKHTTAANYAEQLRLRGVPVRISEDGWCSSAVIQTARAALSYAANPSDVHAALLLRTLGPEPLSLQDALSLHLEDRLFDDAMLTSLAAVSSQIAEMPTASALGLVIDATQLDTWALQQSDGAQARADLLRLKAEAHEFDNLHRDLKAAAGFHGSTVKVFLGWLESRMNERDADRRPDPSADSAQAVEIVTWHASKGREWPITVVAEFDKPIADWPGTTQARFGDLDKIDDMDAVLASAYLTHIPTLAAPETQKTFVENHRPDFEANARNILYVALTRARDRLIIEWPDFLKPRADEEPEAACLFHILEDTCGLILGENTLTVMGETLPATVTRAPDIAPFTELDNDATSSAVRYGQAEPIRAIATTPWRVQPSKSTTIKPPISTRATLGTAWPDAVNSAARGTALHLAMGAALTRPDIADRLPAATGLSEETIALVVDRADTLRAHLADLGYTDLQSEVPIIGATPEGAEISGTIDLIARGPKGCLIVDHKTGGSGDGIGPYWGQLSAYADLVSEHFPTVPVLGVAVHWMDHGTVEAVQMSQDVKGIPAP